VDDRPRGGRGRTEEVDPGGASQEELRELERRSEQDEKNFATMMAGITASLGGTGK
jgi:hypothetical protein